MPSPEQRRRRSLGSTQGVPGLFRWLAFLLGMAIGIAGRAAPAPAATPKRPPNVVIILTDDQGYQDVGCFGARGLRTPNLDRMASDGMRFTDFYAAQAVCSASRAALLTGCYPNRLGITGALFPKSKTGIHSNEITLPMLLKSRGYRTAMVGKWHLGDSTEFLPTHHGFDEYFGLPYSNDMWPGHPTLGSSMPPLPLIEGDRVIETNPDQDRLTTAYTERAVRFIEGNRGQPFFLYVAHAMPHVPLHVSDRFRGHSQRGLYGDVIEEIDWSVGQILDALRRGGLARNTLVVFTSDNGPWLVYGNHGGRALPLREGKATSFDGGVREPCIAWWPGTIPAGRVCREVAGTIDLLPTVARLANAPLPSDRVLDGRDLWPLLSGQRGARSPHPAFFFYWDHELQAVRSGPWKLHFPHSYPTITTPGGDGRPGKSTPRTTGAALYHLESDPGETRDVTTDHPGVVRRLEALAEAARVDLGDSRTARIGRNVRPEGHLDNPMGPLSSPQP